ncbi:MAG: transketolase C-terminal domain-containing protein [Candidatus Peregrinibacteria bacterium]
MIVSAFEESAIKLAKKYPNIVLFNCDCSRAAGAEKFLKYFPDRYFNLGLAEANMVSCAAGFCVRGKIPFITGLSAFVTGKAWEQIRDGICYPNLNVKLICVGLAVCDIAQMRCLPNMKVVCPADYREAAAVFDALLEDYGPTYVRLYEGGGEAVTSGDFEFGKVGVLKEGSDVCIFAFGKMVIESLKAAKILEDNGINAEVVNVSSIKPIDEAGIVKCASGKKLCVTVEDHNIIGGLGSAVAEVLGEMAPVSLLRMGIEDRFGESALGAEEIYKRVMEATRG